MNNIANNIALFDGVCNLCNGAVQFIIKRDDGARFKFAALRIGRELGSLVGGGVV